MLKIEYPIIMAPMFLVTNTKMIISAGKSGITGCIPSLNFRTPEELEKGLKEIESQITTPYGVNLIVNKSNIHYEKHLDICLNSKVAYFITSLGSPEEVIKKAHAKGKLVFCDVTDIEYAKKVEALKADALIAVNSGAGGHLGKISPSILVPMLKKECKIPVISAGGVGTGAGLLSMLALGAAGVSIGSPFIPTTESGVTEGYKKACVDYGAKDIVVTTKLSGTPCTVINTDYVKKIGVDQNPVEKILNQNKQLKKYAKMLTFYKGMKALEKAAFSASYQTVWCAGQSIEFSKKISPVAEIVSKLMKEYNEAFNDIQGLKNV
jgi:nitronate monooxygenase